MVAGRKAYAGSSGYNASRFGVNGFSEALRETDVRVTMIEPGVADAELPEHIPTRTGRRRSSRRPRGWSRSGPMDVAREALTR